MSGLYPDDETISCFGETIRFPGLDANGKYTNGDFNDPMVPPSRLDARSINLILDNLTDLITGSGKIPNNTATDQVLSAVQQFIATHAALSGTGAHGATTAAAASKIMCRDENAYAYAASPSWNDDSAKLVTMATLKTAMLNYVYYVGYIYVQFPESSTPDTVMTNLGLSGTTWTKQFASEGITFRTEGGAALAFEGGIQESANKLHAHNASSGNQSADHTHQFSGTTSTTGSHVHGIECSGTDNAGTYCDFATYTSDHRTNYTEAAGDHAHTFSGSTGGISVSHNHTITIASNGDTEARMRNRTFCIWKRTA